MGVVSKASLEGRIRKGDLIAQPKKREDGSIDLESSSYDLRAGTVVWKDPDSNKVNTCDYKECNGIDQEKVTIQPGQMMFVITLEDIKMPKELCGTVFSRNSLSREGILALNAGHVDPGFRGPIVIRLINLRAIPYTLQLGHSIFTIVFQTVDRPEDFLLGGHLDGYNEISREKTLENTIKSADAALSNALYDLSLLNNFVKADALGQHIWSWARKRFLWILALLSAFTIFSAALIACMNGIMDLLERVNK